MSAGRGWGDDVAHHLVDTLRRTEVRCEPFPHAIIDRALPPVLFDRIVADLPSPELFKALDKIGFASVSRYHRRGARAVADLVEAAPDWTELEKGLYEPATEASLRALFSPWISDAQRVRLHRTLRRELWIDCDLAGSSLPPHTDAPSLFVKSILFLAAAGPHPSADTLLFEPLDAGQRARSFPGGEPDYTDATYKHEDWKDHRILTRIGFRPNRMLTFLRSSLSLHGLGAVAAEAAPRYVLSLHLKYARDP